MSNQLEYYEHFDGKIEHPSLSFEKEHYYYLFHKKKGAENCYSIFKKSDNYHISLSYYIGLDWIENTEHTIYIEPKLNKEDIQTDYLKMLFSALKHPEIVNYTDELFEIKWDCKPIQIKQQQDLLTPLLIVQFLRIVHEIVRKGLKKSYYKVEQNLHCRLKGKVMLGQTIKQNVLKNKLLDTYCSYDEFGVNSIENRLLKKALLFVRRYLNSFKIPGSDAFITEMLNYIMPAFEFVSEDVSLNDIKQSKFNAFYKEYKDGIHLSKMILKRFGYTISNTEQKTILTPPFWIDMSLLFEMYVYSKLTTQYSKNLQYQFQSNYGKLDFLLKNPICIIDTKYKTYYNQEFSGLSEGKRENVIKDIRQISGYARDTKVLNKLGFNTSFDNFTEIPMCLVIYPDQTKDDSIDFGKMVKINEYVNFYKLGIRLPIL
jgi:5-methylcytosine-specific restriction enzyme subunit McrC